MYEKKPHSLICFICALILAILLFIAWNQKNEKAAAASMADYKTYTVQPGDTLWRIAVDEIGKDKDPREFIYIIEKLNGINANIKAGQTIKIPILGEHHEKSKD